MNFFLIYLCLIYLTSLCQPIKVFPLNNRRILTLFSEVKIKINETGYQNVINQYFSRLPDEIYINNIKVGENTRSINVENKEDYIILRWNDKLNYISNMFSYLSNITEIEFINFNSTGIVSLNGMFNVCTSLK